MAAKTEPDAKPAQAADTDRGYRGVAVDPESNETYTVKGVTQGR